jgi:uncharacterized protein
MTSFPQPKSISGPLADSLAYYVYLLLDPRDGKAFYVGKGKGKGERCLQHSSKDDGVAKASKIVEIESAGLTPQIDIIRHGLKNEDEAFLVESAVIDAFGLSNLTNIAPGYGVEKFGRTSLAELAVRYMPEEAEVIHKVVFLKLAQTYRKGMSELELYEAARGVWNFNPTHASKYDYAIVVYQGLVVEVFRIHCWQLSDPSHYPTRTDLSPDNFKGTCEFEGEPADQAVRAHYIGKSVRRYFAAGGLVFNKYGPKV